jgi:hypothetical protein
MTDDFGPEQPADQTTENAADPFGAGAQSELTSDGIVADASVAGAFPEIPKINLENAETAGKWIWNHTLGDRPKRAEEPGGISIDIEDHEETTMRSSSVAHEDPPPPDPNDHRTPHVTEHRDS